MNFQHSTSMYLRSERTDSALDALLVESEVVLEEKVETICAFFIVPSFRLLRQNAARTVRIVVWHARPPKKRRRFHNVFNPRSTIARMWGLGLENKKRTPP